MRARLAGLRGRVAVLATVTVAAVLATVGFAAVRSFEDRERDRLDESLAAPSAPEIARSLGGEPGPGGFAGPPGARGFGPGDQGGPGVRPGRGPGSSPDLGAEERYARVIGDGEVLAGLGAPEDLPTPEGPGLRTIEDPGGGSYRSLARPVRAGILLETGAGLGPLEERVASVRNRLLLIGAAGIGLTAIVAWWLAGLALAPLRRLREAAARVGSTEDLSRRISGGEPGTEVGELTGEMNAMLERLERSAAETQAALEATRRFAGDAGHELRTPMTSLLANAGALRRNPGIDPAERADALAEIEADAARTVRLLETLQVMARGDAAATLPREAVELTALVAAAVESASSRHPELDWRLDPAVNEAAIEGWPDGLRALVDNLLENAARHGGRQVRVSVTQAGTGLELAVDDDGPGIPAEERERVFGRFERGRGTTTAGSGLGLALVRQQAELHGGAAHVEEAVLGGARLVVSLPHG